MSQPVWVLSVDLQTKTATFQTGLAEAAKTARGSFNDIKGGASEMGGSVRTNMFEARHGVMLLGEEFGVHLPRALTSFIASIGPVGAAMEAAFPFLAIAVGATLLIQHLATLQEAGEKLTDDQVKFGTAVNNAFNTLDQKLIQAQIRSDELKNDHLGALKLQLELIDKQSMSELVHNFEEVAKAADVVMKDLEGHWYSFGKGSDGAKHALESFQSQYDNLLSKGDEKGASGLLHGTAKQAQDILQALRDKEALQNSSSPDDTTFQKGIAAAKVLQGVHVETGVTLTKQIEAQQNLVDALDAQVRSEQRIADIKKIDTSNAKGQAGNEESAKRAAAARQAAESMARMGEQSLASDKAQADAALTISRATIEQRLASELDFAGRDRDIKLAANQAEIAGLDKTGKDYQNQLKGLNDKTLEIDNEYSAKAAELTAKASVDEYNRDLRDREQSERAKIEATQQGSAARLTVIDGAIRDEQTANLQDTNFFRELLNMRIETARQEAEEEGKLRSEAGKEAADDYQKSGDAQIAAEKQAAALLDSARRVSVEQRIAEETRFANEEYGIKIGALAREFAALDKSGKDYDNKLKQLQDKEKQEAQQHENELAAIREKAEIEQNQRILAARQQFEDSISRGLTQSIMGHQSWAKTVQALGNQVVSGMIENAIKSMLADDMTKERDAANAARSAFMAGMKFPFPANLVLAPVLAAGAFSAVMAFQTGTDSVPGSGTGDKVPALLEPGEGVVPGGVMDGLRGVARNGGFDQGPRTTVQIRPIYHVQTIDGDGMQAALEKHADQLQHHFEGAVRRMNR